MIGLLPGRIAQCLFLVLIVVPAHICAQSEPSTGDIQIFRNPRESVAVFPRIAPLDKSGALVAPDDPARQLKQALDNLRRLAGRVGVLPGQFVTLTLYVKTPSAGGGLEEAARAAFTDWNPSTTIVETKELRVEGALVEVEGVAIIRQAQSGR
jgi:enamine deaminase RidA (YjgF/YER057c/UK114 family)